MKKTCHVTFSQENNAVNTFTFGHHEYRMEENGVFFVLKYTLPLTILSPPPKLLEHCCIQREHSTVTAGGWPQQVTYGW